VTCCGSSARGKPRFGPHESRTLEAVAAREELTQCCSAWAWATDRPPISNDFRRVWFPDSDGARQVSLWRFLESGMER